MIPFALELREDPLRPAAVVGQGAAASALARRLLRGDRALRGLSAAFADDLLLVQGEADALPWSPGVDYLGLEPSTGAVLLPTTRRFDVDPRLAERALRSGLKLPSGLFAVLADRRVLSLSAAQPLTSAGLQWWLDRAPGAPP